MTALLCAHFVLVYFLLDVVFYMEDSRAFTKQSTVSFVQHFSMCVYSSWFSPGLHRPACVCTSQCPPAVRSALQPGAAARAPGECAGPGCVGRCCDACGRRVQTIILDPLTEMINLTQSRCQCATEQPQRLPGSSSTQRSIVQQPATTTMYPASAAPT